jgi:hypothetical protein
LKDDKNPDKLGYVDLSFGPRWAYVSCVRSFIANFCAISLDNKAQADKISLAASELVENAVKYGSAEDTRIKVEVTNDRKFMVLTVENKATEEQIRVLQEEYKKITTGDPLQAYLEKMKEAALSSKEKSQLGLARIRYETEADISLEFKPESVVSITAKFHIKKGENDE